MNFYDCIRSAQKQKDLTEEEADAIIARYDEHRDARRSAGDLDVEAGAKAALAKELEVAAARKAKIAALSAEKQAGIRTYLEGYRTLKGSPNVFVAAMNLIENFGVGAGTDSIANRAKSIVSLAHGEMADFLTTFRRSRLSGKRFDKPQLDNVVREVLGEGTGSVEAKGMADGVTRTIERLREDFNAAGGDIGKLERYLPQHHEPKALLEVGFDKWRDGIKPKLDLDRMVDPLHGGKLTPERLDETLRMAFDRITTNGWIDREPQARPFGLGALANQRNEHRFLHFKSADDWLAYNRDFGSGDPFKAIMAHVNSMARDIAAMDVLGPNPSATMEWLKQVVQSETAKALAGKPSLYGGSEGAAAIANKLNYAPWRLQAMFDYVRGREQVSGRMATGFANTRNVMTSAQLGSTSILAASTDPWIDMSVRAFSGLPATKALWGIATAIKSEATRAQAIRSGLMLDDAMHVLGDEARYAGTLSGSEWSRWLADRTVNLNGLEPLTQARRHGHGLDWQATLADHVDHSFADLPRLVRRTLEDYGLGAKDWDKMRKVAPYAPDPDGAGWLQPADVAKVDRDLALRYLGMIHGQTERGIPTGTARSRSYITGLSPRGTVAGEILESGLQYKSFVLSFTTLQWQMWAREMQGGLGQKAQGAAYAGSFLGVLTLGGALAMQIQNIVAGKDLQPMEGSKFWMAAMQKGGGFGVMGDFLFSDQTRFGHSFMETLYGPTGGLINDASKFFVANPQEGLFGKKTNVGREAVNMVGRYTPVLSTHPFTRAAYRRMFLDQLQYMADPDAHKYWREQEQRMRRETGQSFFWKAGEMAPERMPEFAPARK